MKVIVVSHGSFSRGVVDTVQMLTGEQKDLKAYSLLPEQSVAELTEQLEEELKNTPEGEEVIFLTDLFHGSPFNAVVSLMKEYRFSHITGINIPFVVALMLERKGDQTAEEVCEAVLETTSETIINVNKSLEREENEEEEEE